MKRSLLFDFGYDPMHPDNVVDRAMDPDDGIDYEALIGEILEDERTGDGIYFSDTKSFLQWFDERLDKLLKEVEENDVHEVT